MNGMMKLDKVVANVIMMFNTKKIKLSKNKDIALMGDIRIKTADSDDVPNRFYIYKKAAIETAENDMWLVSGFRICLAIAAE
jgi:hypothetical protein